MSLSAKSNDDPIESKRYELLTKIASGGMATVYLGRLRGGAGVWRLCALKRPMQDRLDDKDFRRMFVEEARLASKIHHPNVVAVLDVEESGSDLLLVMDYVEGTSLADLMSFQAKETRPLPARIAVRIGLDACAGLQAAHALTDPSGRPLHLVHRDISPQNILVGIDGMARITDFGIAKSVVSAISTTTGGLKGKLSYMAPEYIEKRVHDARSDVFALGVTLWEALTQQRLFRSDNELDTITRIVAMEAPPPSSVAPWLGGRIDGVFERALAKNPEHRFQTAAAFGEALETAARKDDLIAKASEVGAHVAAVGGPTLEKRRSLVQARVLDDPATSDGSPHNGLSHERTTTPEQPARRVIGAPQPSAEREDSHDAGPSSHALTPKDLTFPAGVPRPRNTALIVGVLVLATGLGIVAGVWWTFPRSQASADALPTTSPSTTSATSAVPSASTPPAAASAPAEPVVVPAAADASISPPPSIPSRTPRPPSQTAQAAPRSSPASALPPNPYR